MALIRANFLEGELTLVDASRNAMMREAARKTTAPIVLMAHGYKFEPDNTQHCPHRHIFALEDSPTCWKAKSWPRGLGFGQGLEDEGLAFAFGWNARGTLGTAYKNAKDAALAMAELINDLHAAAPHRPIHAIGHSLGARVISQTLHHSAPGALKRLILLNPAEFRGTAEKALTSAAGQEAEALIVTSGENSFYDMLMSCIIWPERRGDVALGPRLDSLSHVTTLRIDCDQTLHHLESIGFSIAKTRRRFCHWSPYLREGTLGLYSSVFRTPLPLRRLAPERARSLELGALIRPA